MNTLTKEKIEQILAGYPLDGLGKKSREEIIELLYTYHEELLIQNEELKEANHIIEESKKRFETLFDDAPIPYVIINNESVVLQQNKISAEYFGKDVVTKRIESILDSKSQDKFLFYFRKILKSTKVHTSDLAVNTSFGIRYFNVVTKPIILDKKARYVMAFFDHTSEIEYRKKLDFVNQELRNSQRLESIGILASGVAHEINNPINGIMNYAQILIDSEDYEKDIKLYAKEIVGESKRIAKIVKNLLHFSRQDIEEKTWVSAKRIINNTLSLIKSIIKKDQIEININIDEDIPHVYCNCQQIQQVLMNLITNSRDSLNSKYPNTNIMKKIDIKAYLVNKDGNKYMCISVKDHGIGIPDDILDRVFDPFFTTKSRNLGTGLGLSISYGIVKDHKGFIEVESEDNKFCIFEINLPI